MNSIQTFFALACFLVPASAFAQNESIRDLAKTHGVYVGRFYESRLVHSDLRLTREQRGNIENHRQDYKNKVSEISVLQVHDVEKIRAIDPDFVGESTEVDFYEFGKWMQIQFDKQSILCGQEIEQELTPDQNKRLKQIVRQMICSNPVRVRMYSRLEPILQLSSSEKKEIADSYSAVELSLAKNIEELIQRYDRKIRDSTERETSRKLDDLIGDIFWHQPSATEIRKAQLNPVEQIDEAAELDRVKFFRERGFSIDGTINSPPIVNELELSKEQLKELKQVQVKLSKEIKQIDRDGSWQEAIPLIRDETGFEDSDDQAIWNKRKQLQDEQYSEFVKRVKEDVLLPVQVERLEQLIIQFSHNYPPPFGIYQNRRFHRVAKLDRLEAKQLSESVEAIWPEFIEELRQLELAAHEEIRSCLGAARKAELDNLFGTPFGLKKPN